MIRKRLILFISFIYALLFLIACTIDTTSSKSYFDKSAFNSNKSLWDRRNFENYSFEYSIINGGGTAIEAVTTVTGEDSETVIKTLHNTPIDEYPEQYKQYAID